jgi:hypothetical protein
MKEENSDVSTYVQIDPISIESSTKELMKVAIKYTSSKKREKTCTSEEQLAEHQSDDNAEKHRQASQYRHRMVLKLSRIRIVYYILHLRDAMHLPEDP